MLRLPLVSALLALAAGPAAAQHPDPNPSPVAPPDTTAEVSEGWDVSAAHGPTHDVRFTTTEGTWMNLDVSPDGRTIAFDLLGDLYLLPVGGGTARRITSGPAFDLQPRFSPDGTRISFTSDRAGGDNIWTIAVDGSDPQQVTDESFRLLNNAVWTPDGEYLIARKHFTSGRSLGAGEMWMYHRSGGAGLRLTERRNDQQDAGEPALSPDGRFLYFSEDLTPGPSFEYNKDPNAGIYAIRRLDRETGDLDTILRGPGGAARPQPSPDGRHLAFVRRVRDETALFLYDTGTGAETPLTGGLSRDQQETWAIFGVYPNFAWMPDGSALVIWAQGGFHRVDAESGTMTAIPFSAEVEQTVTEAVRSQRPAAEDRLTVRMIRDAATSPDGRTLVFSALGHLWQKRGDATPTRLTTDADHFEYDPAFSPDGRTLVYTTWSDDDLGAIRALDIASGRSRALTTRPGHYHTPRFSNDGRQIVYQRGGGSGLRGGLHALDTGLYVMDADGSDARLVTESGRDPSFSADGSRLIYLTGGGLNKQVKSVDLDGRDCRPQECGERTHFTLEYATDLVPSPDGRHVAFVEAFNVYVAPFPQTGGAVALSKDTKAIPVARVSRDAGTDLHWTDATTLRWLIGEEVFTRSLDDAFAFRPGAPDELPDPDSIGTPIGLVVGHAQPDGAVAFVGGRVIIVDGDRVIEDGTVVVRGNRIVTVGPRAEVDVPADAQVFDVAGKTLMPGLVDVHAHGHFGSGPLPQANWIYYANLAFGVTTMHDPSASTELVFSLSELVKAGEVVGPRVFSTGSILYGADGDIRVQINSLDDARSHLRRLQAVGAFSVKSYNQPRREQRQQVLAAARELDMLVMPEGGSTFFHNVNMVVDGHTGIEHAVPVAPLYNDVLTLWGETTVGYTPTLIVGYGGLWGENYWYATSNVWENERLLRFTPRGTVDARSRRRVLAPDSEWWHQTLSATAADLSRRGVPVYLGAHGQLQGLGAQWELWNLGQGGMTPLEAIRAGTLHGAEYLGMGADLGSIEPGKLADLLVLDGNPLDDLRQTQHIRYTVANGRVFEAATMDQVWPARVERPTFWFERPGASDAVLWQEGAGHAGDAH